MGDIPACVTDQWNESKGRETRRADSIYEVGRPSGTLILRVLTTRLPDGQCFCEFEKLSCKIPCCATAQPREKSVQAVAEAEDMKLKHTAKNNISKQVLSKCGKFHLA